jgi:hypothetical protein
VYITIKYIISTFLVDTKEILIVFVRDSCVYWDRLIDFLSVYQKRRYNIFNSNIHIIDEP